MKETDIIWIQKNKFHFIKNFQEVFIMKQMSNVKKSIITAVCIALCYLVPLLFHGIQNAGQIFCPMHIPVYICGLVCGWPFGLLCGVAGPLLSSALTGMPPIAILPQMMVELAIYGAVAGLVMKLVHTRNTYADLYISLIAAGKRTRTFRYCKGADLRKRKLWHGCMGIRFCCNQLAWNSASSDPDPQHRIRPDEGTFDPSKI